MEGIWNGGTSKDWLACKRAQESKGTEGGTMRGDEWWIVGLRMLEFCKGQARETLRGGFGGAVISDDGSPTQGGPIILNRVNCILTFVSKVINLFH